MNSDVFASSLEHDVSIMGAAARSAGLDADVPTCPGWTVRDLIVHTGVVHRHKSETLRGEYVTQAAPLPDIPLDHVSNEEVLAWFDAGAEELLRDCARADLSEPTWTWCPHEHTKSWWVRRMAHETVIHGADAVIAAGGTPTMDDWLAIDGVNEVLDEFMIGGPAWGTVAPTGEVIRLQASDHEWTVQTAEFSGTSPNSGEEYTGLPSLLYESDAEPTATVSTDPVSLNLWLWGRGELPEGAADGDLELVNRLRATAADATG